MELGGRYGMWFTKGLAAGGRYTIPIHHRDTDGLGTTRTDEVLTEAPS